ncbi:RING-H2 finger protein ATL66-like [Vitis riparia]|uniref:RING-H2 finger protein ATL66-like n=1 Tax=Vitis riparia TaxID=96939 RepID=UPI00155A7DCE|nr:RING-H2 finger protein ATL66-like [Vitis riparia]
MSSQDTSHLRWRYTEFDDQRFEIRGRTLFFIIVLFSFILIITLLFLYARWVCRYNRQVPATSVRPAPTPPPPQGLDPAIISSLPIVLHQQSPTPAGSSIEDCCICLVEEEAYEEVEEEAPKDEAEIQIQFGESSHLDYATVFWLLRFRYVDESHFLG